MLRRGADRLCPRRGAARGLRRGDGAERHRPRPRRRGTDADALRPASATRRRLRRRLDPRLPSDDSRRTRSSVPTQVAEAATLALGLREGIAFPQLIAGADGDGRGGRGGGADPGRPDGRSRPARGRGRSRRGCDPAGARRAGAGRGRDAAVPSAARDPLPHGRRRGRCRPGGVVRDRQTSRPCSPCEGVVQAETYLAVGETIRPVRLDGDRRGYVIATGGTTHEALARAEHAATMLDVEVVVSAWDLDDYADLLRRRAGRAATAAPTSAKGRSPDRSSCATTSTSRSTPRSAWRSSRTASGSRRPTS